MPAIEVECFQSTLEAVSNFATLLVDADFSLRGIIQQQNDDLCQNLISTKKNDVF